MVEWYDLLSPPKYCRIYERNSFCNSITFNKENKRPQNLSMKAGAPYRPYLYYIMVTVVDNVVDLHILKYDKLVEHVNPQQD